MKDLKSGLPYATPHIHPNSGDWWQRNNSKLLTDFLPSFKINLQAIKIYINICYRFNANNVCRLKNRRKILFTKYFHCNHLPCASRGGGIKGF